VSPDFPLAHRLLCAANLAYGVTEVTGETGVLEPLPPILRSPATVAELRAEAGFGDSPGHAHQAAGRYGIDAFLYEETAEAAILAFRGTLPLRLSAEPARVGRVLGDWLNNVRSSLVDGSPYGLPGYVHDGYADSLENLWNSPHGLSRLLGRIAEATASGKRLLVTGHSKGGALALLAALRLARTREPGLMPAGVVTFGAPRAGNAAFAEAFGQAFPTAAWRYEFQDDPVPHLPPSESAWFALREAFDHVLRSAAKSGWSWSAVGVLANFLANVGGYESAGRLLFIDWDGRPREEETPALRTERLERLARILARSPAELNRDHLPMRGFGYMDFLAARKDG
jgi:hypothetical protein